MRAVLLAGLVLGAPVVAHAERLPPVVWKNQVRARPPGVAPAIVSNKLYLNDCRPNGCTVFPGQDDSRTNRTSIAESQVTLDAWAHGDPLWADLVQCVRDTFLPFQVEIVTTDPGSATNHFEVMIGGTSRQLHPELEAGGVAPFVGCGGSDDNVISFVFASSTNDLEFLCGAVAQEAAHVWGLDHELNALDPMTYLDLGSLKRFQNDDARCGETLDAPRECYCGGTTQNSYTYMSQLFGDAPLPPAELEISTPTEGQWVLPGFPVRAVLRSVLGATSATLAIDGTTTATLSPGPFGFNAPATLPGGKHTVTVSAQDGGARVVTGTVNVNVAATCGADKGCADDLHCLGGYCIPGADAVGGLGARCTTNDGCVTGRCIDGSGDLRCTASCDGGDTCPSGFACLADGGGGQICWPSADDGGCAAGGGAGGEGTLASVALGLLVFARRRRR